MIHIYKRNDGNYGVVNLARNKQVIAPNEGFTRAGNAWANILSQWKNGFVGHVMAGFIYVQADYTLESGVWKLFPNGQRRLTDRKKPEKPYVPKKKRK